MRVPPGTLSLHSQEIKRFLTVMQPNDFIGDRFAKQTFRQDKMSFIVFCNKDDDIVSNLPPLNTDCIF